MTPRALDWTRPATWTKAKPRRCLSMHQCFLCVQTIALGQNYYERSGKRAHVACVEGLRSNDTARLSGGGR